MATVLSEPGVMGATVHEFKPRPAWGSLTADVLAAKKFEPVRYVVPGILPEGLAILAGRPKFGKSYLAMNLAIAIASGGFAFGSIECEQGDVLYCALEDGERRLHDRLHQMLPYGRNMPSRLCFETTANRLGDGLEGDLAGWLAAHPEARLVILDTWRCIKPAFNGKGSAYDEDATGLSPLHELTKRYPGVAFVLVHHVRKMDAEDVFDTISGTHGLTGVADTLMVLGRHGEGAKLSAQGRDLEGYEKALNRDSMTGGWIMAGDAKVLAKTGERQVLLNELAEADGEPLRTSVLAKKAGVSESSASHRLKALIDEGLVEKAGYGKWRLKTPYQGCQSRQSGMAATPDFDDVDDFDGGAGE